MVQLNNNLSAFTLCDPKCWYIVEFYNTILSDILKNFAPVVEKYPQTRPTQPW